ncbi:MAG: class I SAM-dependent methyltransferase [Sedimentisphaerales bacterium]
MSSSMPCIACGHESLTDLGMIHDGRLFRCYICGTSRLEVHNKLSLKAHAAYGDAYRAGLDLEKPRKVFELFQKILKGTPGKYKDLLDVGCGDGAFLKLAKQNNWNVLGIDSDPKAVATARKHGIQAFLGTAGKSALVEKSFDVITLWDILEHIPNLKEVIVWLANIIRPGGKIFVLTPNADSILDTFAYTEIFLTRRKSQRLMNLCFNRYHLHRFTTKGLIILLRRLGFSDDIVYKMQLFSLKPELYLSGFAPGVEGWTRSARFNQLLSSTAYQLLQGFGIKNKILYVGTRVEQKNICAPPQEQEGKR